MLTWTNIRRRLLSAAATMTSVLLTAGCALDGGGDHAGAVGEMRRIYRESVSGENEPLHPRYVALAYEFWSLYTSERDRTSQRVMLDVLRKIITENGVSELLLRSVPPGLRGPKEDALVDEMILADTPSTPKADQAIVQSAELTERLRLAAQGRRVGGGR